MPTKVRHIRISDDDYATYHKAAEAWARRKGNGDEGFSAWVREVLSHAAARELARAAPPSGGAARKSRGKKGDRS